MKGEVFMPFKKVNTNEEIKEKMQDKDFREAYSEIDQEYKLMEEIIEIRKSLGLSQVEVAQKAGLKQQEISRIECIGNSPTLRSFLKYLDAIGLKISIQKKPNNNICIKA